MRTSRFYTLLESLLGVALGFIVAELLLWPVATSKAIIPQPDEASLKKYVEEALQDTPIIEVRQFQEGFGIAHFASDGRRLTGNEEISNVPSGVILGDSFVEALQVGDTETMGSVIERLSRATDRPENVRQYGWGGTSTATYLAVSNLINSKWKPKWVAVLFNNDDFTEASINGGRSWRLEINPATLDVTLYPVPRSGQSLDKTLAKFGTNSDEIRSLINKSTLAYLLLEKYLLASEKQDSSEGNKSNSQIAQELEYQRTAASAMTRALKRAYGETLLIVYVPQIDAQSAKDPDEVEKILSDICHTESVEFVSTRDSMIQARDSTRKLPEGFYNTIPGGGHLNKLGHQLVGQEIWNAVRNK